MIAGRGGTVPDDPSRRHGRPGRTRTGLRAGPGCVADRYPCGRRASRGRDPRGVHHRQIHARLLRAGLLPDGDRCPDLLRVVRFPVVPAVGEIGGYRWSGAVGASLRLAPGPAHHAGLRRHRADRLRHLSLPNGRAQFRPHLDRVVAQSDFDADLHQQLPEGVFASGSDPDVEPGGGSRLLRGASAAGLPAAGGPVPAAMAAEAGVVRPRRAGADLSGMADLGAPHDLGAERNSAMAAHLPDLVPRRHEPDGAAGDGGALLRVHRDTARHHLLLHRLYADRGGSDDVAA